MATFRAPDGLELFYRDEGAGLPVIALAGLTRNGEDFDFVAPHLAHIRLIRPDYRGRGRSPNADPATYAVPNEAADVLALMDHLGLERAAILGTSRGGLIALTLAAMARERLKGICFNDVGPVLELGAVKEIAGWLGKAPTARDLDEAARQRPRFLTGFANVAPERWREEVAHLYTETQEGLAIRYDPALAQTMKGLDDAPLPDLWPLFDACEGLPLALIRGANSDLLSEATAREMRARRPDMLFCDVPDRGHVPFLDEPEALTVLSAWLKEMA